MSFPKKGKFFPKENGNNEEIGGETNGCFVEEIASALKRSLGDSSAGIKTVAVWTGANEKTVKNRGSGVYGPRGAHLIALAALRRGVGDIPCDGGAGSHQARGGRGRDCGIASCCASVRWP